MTPDALQRAIAHLYRQLPGPVAANQWRQTPAYLEIEAQIRALAARHWQLTSGCTISDAPPPDLRGIRG